MSTDVAPITPDTAVQSKVASLANGAVTVWSSFTEDNHAARIALMSALTNAQPIEDHLGETLEVSNFVAQAVEVADDDGVLTPVVRTILVTSDGQAYAAVSDGLFRSMQNIIGVIGMPHTWEAPLRIQVVERKSRKGYKFYTVLMA